MNSALEVEDIHDIDEYKLNPETMEKLKDSWKTLQERWKKQQRIFFLFDYFVFVFVIGIWKIQESSEWLP